MSDPTNRYEPPDGPDGLDGWLNTPVEPLLPPPGTYQSIVRRARHRRTKRALTSACAAAAVIAAAAIVPQISSLLAAQPEHPPVVATQPHTAPAPPPAATPSTSPAPNSTGGTGPLLAPGFTPLSVTFIGLDSGWALGRYTASCPGNGCTALARTDDTGQHWHRVNAPDSGAPAGSSGVSQVRFLTRDDGWVFGPELWATHDGGGTWNQVGTGGQRVISLETAGDRAFAVFASCPGAGSGWNTGCSSYQLYSAAAGGGPWTPVPGASGPGTATVVLTGQTGYLLAQDGDSVTLSSGPLTGTGTWAAAPPVPCGTQSGQAPAGPASPSSPPAGTAGQARGGTTTGSAVGPAAAGGGSGGAPALLAAASASDLYLLCPAGGSAGTGAASPVVYLSTDGGQHWQQRGSAPAAASATSFAAAGGPGAGSGGTVLIATGSGVDVSGDGGMTWQMSFQAPGGAGYVGMTNTLQGVAVPASGTDAIWFTEDGGQSWHRSGI